MSDDLKRFTAVPGLSVASSLLLDKLKAGAIGDVLTDEEMTGLCGKDTRAGGAGYGCLQTAIRRALDAGLVWKRVEGANCIKCLDPSEIVEYGASSRKHVHRQTKRMMRRLGVIDREALPEPERAAVNVQIATFGALAILFDRKTVKKLEARNINQPLDIWPLLEHLK